MNLLLTFRLFVCGTLLPTLSLSSAHSCPGGKPEPRSAATAGPGAASFSVWSQGGAGPLESYALVLRGRSECLHITDARDCLSDLRSLKRSIAGDFAWFRAEGKSYVIQDPATLARLRACFKDTESLDAEEAGLDRESSRLDAEQDRLDAQQEALEARQEKLDEADEIDQDWDEDAPKAPARPEPASSAREAQRRAIQQECRALQEKQEALAREQARLGQQQEALGQRQEAAFHQAEAELWKRFQEAIAQGSATAMDDRGK